jgi:sec-independent protein translocase protein TatA
MTGLLSPAHIAILLLVLLLVFGAKRLPELGRSLGSGLREFKHTLDGDQDPEQPTLAPAPAAIAGSTASEPATTTVAQPVPAEPPATRPAA